MPLALIQGPPNSGRAGLVRRRLLSVLGHDPVLVVPTIEALYAFERELSENGAVLGATVTTFAGLFESIAEATGTAPAKVLTPAQRQGAIAAAAAELRGKLGPLGSSSRQPGFSRALARLLDELQGAGREPVDVEAVAGTLEGSAYLADVAALFGAYAAIRKRLGVSDSHDVAQAAIRGLREAGEGWRGRPVFLYGLDDLTGNQLELIRALTAVTEVTVALPYEADNSALAARGALLESLRGIGVDSVTESEPAPQYTDSPLLFQLERGFGAARPERPGAPAADGSLGLLRSAGERGEAEAIAAAVTRLIAAGEDPEEIAIVVRDPGRRGPLIAATLESYGAHAALDAEIGVASTSVGGSLLSLLEALYGSGRAADLLRYLRGPAGISAGRADRFERALRRGRVVDAERALALWEQSYEEPAEDVATLRGAGRDPRRLAAAVAAVAAAMASRIRGRAAAAGIERSRGAEVELRAAAAIAKALGERAALPGLAPAAAELPGAVAELSVRAWTGPTTGRVRIAAPDRFRGAGRFDHVFVASLQDGEFPRREGRGDPFLSERQRLDLSMPPRRDSEAEERYLFHACLALPKRRLVLSYRDCDENGAAEARSPFLDDVRRLLDPAPPAPGEEDPLEEELTESRDLAQVVHRIGSAPSADELARAIAARGAAADPEPLLAASAPPPALSTALGARLAAARATEVATRAPGPIANPEVLARLAAVPAYGGTTLERFDGCSYRWFVEHELRPRRLDPDPDPLAQGGLMHDAFDRLYREPPEGGPLPRPETLAAWQRRGRDLVRQLAAERRLGNHPAERAIVRRVETLIHRFLAEEAERDPGGFRPWLLEAGFGADEESEQPALAIGDWHLHGAIDRVDRADDGRAVVIDYKASTSVTPRAKFEQDAKLQLQLYLTAVEQLWGAKPVAGLYYPVRGSSSRQPRGLADADAAAGLAGYGLAKTDLAEGDDFTATLEGARERASAIVTRMRAGEIRRDPGPRRGLQGHDICPAHCEFGPICRRDRAPAVPDDEDEER